MWHGVLIGLHAGTGVLALLAGLGAHRGPRWFAVYFWSLVATVVFLAAAVVEEWATLDVAARVLFTAFVGLGVVMVRLAVRARGLGLTPRHVDLVGFTLVALFDAFMVITVLDAGVPAAVATGVVVATAGHLTLRTLKSRLTASPTLTPRESNAQAR